MRSVHDCHALPGRQIVLGVTTGLALSVGTGAAAPIGSAR